MINDLLFDFEGEKANLQIMPLMTHFQLTQKFLFLIFQGAVWLNILLEISILFACSFCRWSMKVSLIWSLQLREFIWYQPHEWTREIARFHSMRARLPWWFHFCVYFSSCINWRIKRQVESSKKDEHRQDKWCLFGCWIKWVETHIQSAGRFLLVNWSRKREIWRERSKKKLEILFRVIRWKQKKIKTTYEPKVKRHK